MFLALVLVLQDTVGLAALTDGGVAVVDLSRGKVIKKIEGLTDATFGVAVNPADRKQGWAVGQKTGQLFELDLTTWTVKGEPIALGGKSHQVVTTRDGKLVLVTVPGDNTLTIVHTGTRAVSKIDVPDLPHIVDIDRAANHVFVSRQGAKRGATFIDLGAIKHDFAKGGAVKGVGLEIPVNGIPRVVSALGGGRFALALYGKRGPVIYEIKDGKAAFIDDLDNAVKERPRAAKDNMEYCEGAWLSADGKTLVGTDQGSPSMLRVWNGATEVRAIELPFEPYWACVSRDGKTAWVTIPKVEKSGRVLTVSLETGEVTQSVALVGTPKRMVVME